MPRKKSFSLVTGKEINVDEGLSHDEMVKRLLAPLPPGLERRIFAGDEEPWEPSVRIGKPRAAAKKTRKAATPAAPKNGTKFEETGAKAAE